MKAPEFFDPIREKAEQRWQQLEADDGLAGPWRQLFSQVQFPDHVLSELLQNADDAEARNVRVLTAEEELVFEHDGNDFTEDDFRSLCEFGISNKRNLHTIGFRGMGFKTAFSLGDSVTVATPTLRVTFEKTRFTLPEWTPDIPGPSPGMRVRISVRFRDAKCRQALQESLRRWQEIPTSVLFFRRLETLDLAGFEVRRQDLGTGPCPNSRRYRLEAQSSHEVLLLESAPEPLPDDALEEVREERRAQDFDPPPVRVQLVLGVPDPQRAFVVLPSETRFDLPWSCNAPFLQDPARSKIKDVARSPLNRWLLERVGRLAAEALLAWLRNTDLSVAERAKAYRLLPEAKCGGDRATAQILEAFERAIDGEPIVLTREGSLAHGPKVLAPPSIAREVWEDDEGALRALFSGDWDHLVASEVAPKDLHRLEGWSALETRSEKDLWERLRQSPEVRRPRSFERLLRLHSAVQRKFAGSDPIGWERKRLSIWPAGAAGLLRPANTLIRLPGESSQELVNFLERLVDFLDTDWIRYLERSDSEDVQTARKLIKDCELDQKTKAERIIESAAKKLGSSPPSPHDVVLLAQAAAALDAEVPDFFSVSL